MWSFWIGVTACVAVSIIGNGIYVHHQSRQAGKGLQDFVDKMEKVERP